MKRWQILVCLLLTGTLVATCVAMIGGRGKASDGVAWSTVQTALKNAGDSVATPVSSPAPQLRVVPPDNGGHDSAVIDGKSLTNGTNGTTNAVVLAADGTQYLTVIKDASAPVTYRYAIDLPPGGSIAVTADGQRAAVFDGDHKAVGLVDAAWAKDANGAPVGTHYTTDGTSLTQVIDHHAQAAAYPIVADPYFRWYWNGVVVSLTPGDMDALVISGIAALPALIGIPGVNVGAVASIGWMGTYAAWATAHHKCGWVWIGLAGWHVLSVSGGWYDC